MQNITEISEDLFYLGGNDRRIALFESAFPVPRGVSYNSYLLKDEKTVLFDTVDLAVSELFFENLTYALGGRTLDYVVIHHMEPDHSASFSRLIERYPEAKIVVNAKTAKMLENYFGFTGERIFLVKEGDALSVGKHTVSFLFAPMVHWPEVMMSYIPEKKLLFSADAFGTFGALGGSIFADGVDFDREFLDDARRYYFNIVGKYGVQVQNVLKKAAALEIGMINSGLTRRLSTSDTLCCDDSSLIFINEKSDATGLLLFFTALLTLSITFSLPWADSLHGNG